MHPNFAIHFQPRTAQVLHLAGRNKWTVVGEVPTEDGAASENPILARTLRKRLARLGGWSVAAKLVIPNSISYYTECSVAGLAESAIESEVQKHLTSTTPFQLDEIAYDWYTERDVAKIAYVFRQNLEEAEEFAVEWNFNPIYSEAHPPPDAVFQRRAFFGLTRFAATRKCSVEEVKARATAITEPDPISGSAWVGNGQTRKNALPGLAGAAAAGMLAIMIGAWAPTATAVSVSAERLAQYNVEQTGDERVAQLSDKLRLEGRPARRPLQSENGSAVASSRPYAAGAGSTYAIGIVSARELVDRGFDPYAINGDLLSRFKLGVTDTVQADMIARIRQTVPLIDRFETDADLQEQDLVAEAAFEVGPADSSLTSSSELQEELLAHLKGRPPVRTDPNSLQANSTATKDPINQLVVNAILRAQGGSPDAATETASAGPANSGIALPTQRPRRRNLPESASAGSVGTPLNVTRPLRRSVADGSIRVAQASTPRATEADGPTVSTRFFTDRSGSSGTSVGEPVQVASADPQATRRSLATQPEDSLSYVLSQANETITIDEGGATLIGIYGSDADRRALVRSASGRFSTLYLGSEFNGGRVVEIRRNEVIFDVRGKRVKLSLP